MKKPNRIHLFVRGKSNLNQLKLTSEAAGKINQGGSEILTLTPPRYAPSQAATSGVDIDADSEMPST